jgi:hypothetical protein
LDEAASSGPRRADEGRVRQEIIVRRHDAIAPQPKRQQDA